MTNCSKCKLPCSSNDQAIKAYHRDCFTCEDCHVNVAANKHYFMEDQQLRKKVILCEFDYLKRSNSIICLKCNKPITSLSSNQQHYYHPECIQCPSCFTHSPHQYEYKGINYCRLHYSLLTETHCAGCNQAVLKQFVELLQQVWHPECYMIYKFWNIKLKNNNEIPIDNEQELIQIQNETYTKVKRVWTDLSSFEESSANCISDMLLNVAAGVYTEGIRMANQFVMHLDVLFSALSKIQATLSHQNQEYHEQASLICKEIIHFFTLLTLPKSENYSIIQQLLSLVTSIAQNLKYLIRVALSSSQCLEQLYGHHNAMFEFLDELLELDKKRVWIAGRYWFKDSPVSTLQEQTDNNLCTSCQTSIQNQDCFQSEQMRWHVTCFQCSNCSTQLDLQNAVLVASTLYCTSCRPKDPHSPLITLSYSYQQNLHHLKIYLRDVAKDLLNEKKTPSTTDILLMPKTKRQRSILRLLSSQHPSEKKQEAVHVGQVGRTSSITLKTSSIHQPLKINTTTAAATTTTTTMGEMPSPTVSPINRISRNIKRTFSTKHPLNEMFENNEHVHERYMVSFNCSQDYILRHAAVIQLHTHHHFSLDELVSWINPKKYPSALWNRLLVHLRPPQYRIFGAPLAAVTQRDDDDEQTPCHVSALLNACFSDRNALIPIFIKSCVMTILQSDMSVEGVFRKNGNIRQLKKLLESIDNLQQVTMNNVELLLANQNGIHLAALLKRYLRELPEPLFTYSLYKLFVQCGHDKRALHLACCLLPKPNRDTMIMLFSCLKWVATFSDTSKMNIHNLARTIAPTVLYDKPSHTVDLQKWAQEEIHVIETLIRDIDEIAQVPYDVTLLTLHDIRHDLSDLNSKYFITEYQKLLKDTKKSQPPLQNLIP